ncbi:MAG TPA: hypothetical protein VG538_02775 [Vicinamibacterales bacterium]|nr:hypothetical protein [Vicinamibacterales bacterium]
MLAVLLVGMLGAVLAVAAWVIGWILLVRGEGGGMDSLGFEIAQLLIVALIGFAVGAVWTLSGRRRRR